MGIFAICRLLCFGLCVSPRRRGGGLEINKKKVPLLSPSQSSYLLIFRLNLWVDREKNWTKLKKWLNSEKTATFSILFSSSSLNSNPHEGLDFESCQRFLNDAWSWIFIESSSLRSSSLDTLSLSPSIIQRAFCRLFPQNLRLREKCQTEFTIRCFTICTFPSFFSISFRSL